MTVACQTPLFMGFSRQEYWGGLPFPPPGHLPNPGIEPRSSPTLQTDSLPSESPGKSSLRAQKEPDDGMDRGLTLGAQARAPQPVVTL